jgi:CheY-like chemotaxis protein
MSDVLIVDDDPTLLTVLAEIFKQRGYFVRTASDGFLALALLRNRVPDVLISDLNMPGMSGFELLSVVRRRFPAVAVIAMSGAYSGTAVPDGIAADGFYAKGSTTISRLWEILHLIDDAEQRQAARAAVPIWIPGPPTDQADVLTAPVACPQCLRTFFHPLPGDPLAAEESHCTHCMSPVRLAIVKASEEMDRTALSIPISSRPVSDLAFVCPDARESAGYSPR